MRISTMVTGLAAWFAADVAATALTYKLAAGEKACFYAQAPSKGQKIAFYFAVRGIDQGQSHNGRACYRK